MSFLFGKNVPVASKEDAQKLNFKSGTLYCPVNCIACLRKPVIRFCIESKTGRESILLSDPLP